MSASRPLTVLLLVMAVASVACSSDGDGDRAAGGPSTSTEVTPTTSEAPGQPRTPLETRVIDALGSIGIEAGRAEHPGPNEANIWTPNGETELFVHAVTVGVTRAEITVLGERSVDGVVVSKVRYETSGSVRESFDCGGTTYEVYGDVPSRFADVDELLVQFVDSLDCVGLNGG